MLYTIQRTLFYIGHSFYGYTCISFCLLVDWERVYVNYRLFFLGGGKGNRGIHSFTCDLMFIANLNFTTNFQVPACFYFMLYLHIISLLLGRLMSLLWCHCSFFSLFSFCCRTKLMWSWIEKTVLPGKLNTSKWWVRSCHRKQIYFLNHLVMLMNFPKAAKWYHHL